MFRCELCAHVPELKGEGPKVWPPRTRCVIVPLEYRATEYPSRPKAQSLRVGRKRKSLDDPGGAGWEIAKEVRACRDCADRWQEIITEDPSRAHRSASAEASAEADRGF